jgi:hypothetical protein
VRTRGASPFFYAGLASRYEDERLTEDDRDALPDRINELRGAKFGNWLSEREWIPVMLETADKPRRLQLKLDVNEANVDELERQSCEEIFLARERESKTAIGTSRRSTSSPPATATRPTAAST